MPWSVSQRRAALGHRGHRLCRHGLLGVLYSRSTAVECHIRVTHKPVARPSGVGSECSHCPHQICSSCCVQWHVQSNHTCMACQQSMLVLLLNAGQHANNLFNKLSLEMSCSSIQKAAYCNISGLWYHTCCMYLPCCPTDGQLLSTTQHMALHIRTGRQCLMMKSKSCKTGYQLV